MYDYLNSKGVGLNWLNNKPFSETYIKKTEEWKHLPIYQNGPELKKFIKAMKDDKIQLIVVKAGTGTGKTAIIPKVVLKSEMEKRTFSKPWKIAMTIPKQIPTKDHGNFAATTLDTVVGNEVGYIHRGSNSADYDHIKGRLTYITDGYLLALSQNDATFSDYSVIIIDEAHERSKNIDFLIFKLKKALRLRKGDFKVIIVSATIEPSLFINFFCDTSDITEEELKKQKSKYIPIYQTVTFTSGTTHPIEEHFLPSHQANMTTALDMALKKDLKKGTSAVVFVPTSKETEKGCQDVKKACDEGSIDKSCKALNCKTLYSKMDPDDQKKATEKPDNSIIKIVFSTNIAESSVTINGLKVVIDTGLEFQILWNPLLNLYIRGQSPTTKAQILQRKGRVGRKSPGTVYYLYSKENFDKRQEMPDPNIHKVDLTEDVLKLIEKKKLISHTLNDLKNFLSPPTKNQILSAFYNLYLWGFIRFKNENNQLDTQDLLSSYDEDISKNDDKSTQNTQHYNMNFILKEGNITELGLLAVRFLNILKSSLWNILILLAGFVLYKKNKIDDIILLYSILELSATSTDPISFILNVNFKSGAKALDFKKYSYKKANYNIYKEHASLIRLFTYLEDLSKVSYQPYVNLDNIKNIREHFLSTKELLMKENFIKNDKIKDYYDKYTQNNILDFLSDKTKWNMIDVCIFYARNIYLSLPKKSTQSIKLETVKTLIPFQSKISNDYNHEKNEYVAVFENASVMIKPDVNVNDDKNSNSHLNTNKIIQAEIKMITTYPKSIL